jgi:hypothetical protein
MRFWTTTAAIDGGDDRRELQEHTVPGRLDDSAAVARHDGIDHGAMLKSAASFNSATSSAEVMSSSSLMARSGCSGVAGLGSGCSQIPPGAAPKDARAKGKKGK